MSIKMILATIAAIVALGSITTLGFNNSALGQAAFTADLSGDDELPPVDTNATGIATFQSNGNTMNYQLSVSDLNNVTAAHIHRGDSDHNGKVVVNLYNNKSKGPQNGLLSQGTITASNLIGPLAGHPLSDLIDIMDNGTAYVNAHTKDFPLGEIRGQVEGAGGGG
jgi:CHRD domain-containing protein